MSKCQEIIDNLREQNNKTEEVKDSKYLISSILNGTYTNTEFLFTIGKTTITLPKSETFQALERFNIAASK